MAKYDHGGGCSCGLYKECTPECKMNKIKDSERDEIIEAINNNIIIRKETLSIIRLLKENN